MIETALLISSVNRETNIMDHYEPHYRDWDGIIEDCGKMFYMESMATFEREGWDIMSSITNDFGQSTWFEIWKDDGRRYIAMCRWSWLS